MKLAGKLIAMGLALATVTGVAATASPAQAQTRVYLGVGTGSPGYYPVGYGYHGDYRGRDPYWRGGYRDWDRRGRWDDRRRWRGDGWRGNNWRGGYGYRERCWTEWRGGRWGRNVRVCR